MRQAELADRLAGTSVLDRHHAISPVRPRASGYRARATAAVELLSGPGAERRLMHPAG